MRKKVTLLGLVLATAFAANARAIPVNLSFEDGNTGWTSVIPSGGAISVDTNWLGDQGYNYLPTLGSYFARLAPDGTTAPVTLSQTFTVPDGYVLKGKAAFDSRDHILFPELGPGNPYDDYAWVRIYQDSTLIAEPWYASVFTVGDYGDGPWESWEYTFATGGTYRLEYGVLNVGDTQLDSYAMYDAVPEPATILLLGAGLLGVGARARRNKGLGGRP